MDVIVKLVTAVNAINSNVWAFLALCLGVFLSVHGVNEVGHDLILGSFALLQGGKGTS